MNYELIKKLLETLKLGKIKRESFHSLSQGEYGILNALMIKESEGCKKMTPGEIGKEQNLTSGRVSTTLKSLEKKHYILRETDAIDKRKTLVSLTLKGRELALKIISKIKAELNNIVEKLGEKDTLELIRLLNILNS